MELAQEFSTPLGGKRDHEHSVPLLATVRVAHIFEGRFVMSGHLAKNMAIDMGTSVVLRIGNIHIIVTTRSGPHFAPELFQTAGIDPFTAQLLVAKSPCGFRAAYGPGQSAFWLFVRRGYVDSRLLELSLRPNPSSTMALG